MPGDLFERLFSLRGQAAIVTGGSRGIGLEIARALGEAGAKVAIVARRAEWLEPAARELKAAGITCAAFAADVADADQVAMTVDAAQAAIGDLSILVNAAGRTARKPTVEVSEEEWSSIINTNLTGMLRACQSFS